MDLFISFQAVSLLTPSTDGLSKIASTLTTFKLSFLVQTLSSYCRYFQMLVCSSILIKCLLLLACKTKICVPVFDNIANF